MLYLQIVILKMSRMNAFFAKTIKNANILNNARGVIHNKFVLYFIFFAALFQLLFSIVHQDYLYCVLFLLVGFLVQFFNKNMTVILTLAMAISTVLSNILKGSKLNVEGLETQTQPQPKNDKESDEDAVIENAESKEPTEPKQNKNMPNAPIAKKVSTPAETTPSKLMESLKEQALDLQEAQKHIIDGFEKIEPHMDKAEKLIGNIEQTAKTIQGMRNMQNV